MLTRRRQGAIVVAAAFTVGLAACSSSTAPAPAPETPSQLAAHFDSIYASLLAGDNRLDSNSALNLAILVETSPAFGSLDAPFTLTTTSGTQTWQGLTYELVNPGDSTFVTAMYNNRDLAQVIFVEQSYANNMLVQTLGAATTNLFATVYFDSVMTGSASVVSTGPACARQNGLQADSVYSLLFASAICESAKFNISLSMAFHAADAAVLGPLSNVSITNATLNGPRFTGATFPQRVVAIPSQTAALLMRVQALLHRHR